MAENKRAEERNEKEDASGVKKKKTGNRKEKSVKPFAFRSTARKRLIQNFNKLGFCQKFLYFFALVFHLE